jgi:hypothetical protein
MNPGYRSIVTRFKSANVNPAGNRTKLVIDHDELEQIKNKTRQVWSAKDNSETTYGHFHSEPKLSDKARLRPTSPNRRNNPHPHLYIFKYLKILETKSTLNIFNLIHVKSFFNNSS